MLVQALYQWQLADHDRDELLKQFRHNADYERIDQNYFREVLDLVLTHSAELDRVISEHASRGMQQLDAVGRAVLWLALAELRYRADVPTRVVINEAIELTKRFGATDSFKFVNALLDKASRRPDVRGPAS